MWATTLVPEDAHHDRSTTPRPDQRRPIRLGPGPVRLPDREGQPLGLQADRRVIQPDAMAVLRRAQLDAGSSQARRGPRLGPWHRLLWSNAIVNYSRCQDRLPVFLLPLPHPDGLGRLQPL